MSVNDNDVFVLWLLKNSFMMFCFKIGIPDFVARSRTLCCYKLAPRCSNMYTIYLGKHYKIDLVLLPNERASQNWTFNTKDM